MPPNTDDPFGQGRKWLARASGSSGLVIPAVLALVGLCAWTSFYTVQKGA